jgi:6-phosphofructokinase 1
MGRHAGFLTAASALARQFPDDGPHLVYVPERTFDMDAFLTDVKGTYERFGRCVIAVSEGIQDKDGRPIITQFMSKVEKDAHGNVQLSGTGALGDLLSDYIREKLHIKRVRSDTFGYLQRSFMGCVSDVDQIEAREVGERAAQYAILHNLDGSVTIHRVGNYAVDYRLTDIREIAAKTRHLPDEYINGQGNDVTEAFLAYARPLVGAALPRAARLRAPLVDKILSR